MARWALAASAVFIFVGAGAIPVTRSAQQPLGLGYVNSDIVLQQTPGYQAADSALRAEMQSYEDEVRRLQTTLDSAQRAYDQQSIVLSPAAKQDKLDELRQMNDRFQQRWSELQQRAQERRRELVAPLESRIQTVIDGVRAERNLAFIFDVTAPGGNIVSADRALDLTPLIVSRLRGTGGP